MGKLYSEMTAEEKLGVQRHNATYRSKHPEMARKAALDYYYRNKEKAAAKAKKWREENKDYVREMQRKNKRERKDWAVQYLGNKCQLCGQSFHPAIYEFHHRNPEDKDRDPSKMLQLSLDRLQKELDKCDLLCANCHRYTHHKDSYSV
jgi:hypothetical protein